MPKNINDLLNDFDDLNESDQNSAYNRIRAKPFGGNFRSAGLPQEVRERRFHKGINCFDCSSPNVVKNGKSRQIQRYKCKDCGRTFGDLTATPMSRSRYRDKWIDYFELMLDGKSIRESAKVLEISVSTSFMWRHKILAAILELEQEPFDGITEVDETFIRHSEKGSRNIIGRKPRKRGEKAKLRGISKEQDCIVVAVDRTGRTHALVACRGRLSRRQAEAVMGDLVKDVTTLCSDKHNAWEAFARSKGLDHVVLNASKGERVKKSVCHIQNVNSFHRRWKRWMDRFNGVASKFLNNYLAWYRFLEAHKRETNSCARDEFLLAACMTISPTTYRSIKQTEFTIPA
jgi:transposase-like protein